MSPSVAVPPAVAITFVVVVIIIVIVIARAFTARSIRTPVVSTVAFAAIAIAVAPATAMPPRARAHGGSNHAPYHAACCGCKSLIPFFALLLAGLWLFAVFGVLLVAACGRAFDLASRAPVSEHRVSRKGVLSWRVGNGAARKYASALQRLGAFPSHPLKRRLLDLRHKPSRMAARRRYKRLDRANRGRASEL
jgi:hypothetical protein